MDLIRIEQILKEYYGLTPLEISRQAGYENATFRIRIKDGFLIAKTHKKNIQIHDLLEAEARVLEKIAGEPSGQFPLVIKDQRGSGLIELEGVYFRLLSFVPGEFLAETRHSEALQASFGEFLGALSGSLEGLYPEKIGAMQRTWDLQHLEKVWELVPMIASHTDRRLITHFLYQFQREVLPHRYKLRKSLIHNDANDWNVLCSENKVSGLIDFGDLCYSWTINEVAVGLTYLLMDKENPLEVASTFLKAFNQKFPLQALEADLLYYLIAGRLCMSLCHSASKAVNADNPEYIRISEAGARALLYRWIAISPDRAAEIFRKSLGLPAKATVEVENLKSRRSKVLGKSLSLSYKSPIVMKRAAMQYMYDAEGRTFLDAYNNIMLVGHCHPRVTMAAAQTSARLNTNTRYYYDEILDYAEYLLSWFPEKLNRVFFVNSGSAATDLALRMVRSHTGRNKVLCLDHGYHGNTESAVEVSPYKHPKSQTFQNTVIGPFPKYEGEGDRVSWLSDLKSKYRNLIAANSHELAGIIAEPVMGCGGQLPLPEGLLKDIYPQIREQGGLCISDEVQVGFGRLGKWKWGFQMHDVIPDLVILGKPMGNGHPIGAVITTKEVSESFSKGPEFFSSFGGNPVSCTIGKAVLEVMEEEGLQQQALEVGEFLTSELNTIAADSPLIREVRGSGLFLGIEFAQIPGNNATKNALYLCNELRNRGVLTGLDGPGNTVLKIKPPLVFNTTNARQLVEETGKIMRKIKVI